MKQTNMTRRERDVYDYIVSFRARYRISPTIQEITEGIGLYSPSTVHRHVHNMIEKGFLTQPDGRSRAIMPVEDRAMPGAQACAGAGACFREDGAAARSFT